VDIIKIKLIDITLVEDNVRLHPKRQIEEYKRSLTMFGQTKNAVVDENNTVLIGNGLIIAARELGWEDVYAKQILDLSENDKLKLMVSDNKIFGLGVDNLDTIDSIFERLRDDLDIPGYDEETLKTMIADTETVTAEIFNYGQLTPEAVSSIQNRPEPRIPTTPAPPPSLDVPAKAEMPIHEENSGSKIEAEDSVLISCPKCGESHWLPKDVLRPLM